MIQLSNLSYIQAKVYHLKEKQTLISCLFSASKDVSLSNYLDGWRAMVFDSVFRQLKRDGPSLETLKLGQEISK